jgi:hypothetical protein
MSNIDQQGGEGVDEIFVDDQQRAPTTCCIWGIPGCQCWSPDHSSPTLIAIHAPENDGNTSAQTAIAGDRDRGSEGGSITGSTP